MANIKRPISGAGTRLKEELDARPDISVRKLERTMKKKGVRGSSYSTIWGYLRGRVEPDLEFLRAAADLLGVRAGYLQTGEPPRTENEQAVELHAVWSEQSTSYSTIADRLEGVFDAMRGIGGFSPAMQYTLLEAVERLRLHEGAEDDGDRPERLGRAVMAPLKALGIDPGDVSPYRMRDYTLGVCTALMAVLRAPGDWYRPKEEKDSNG